MTVSKNKGMDPEQRELLAQALAAVERMQAKLAANERASSEPIAIVGAGCRFPGGVDSPDRFWELLRDGRNAVTKMPSDRWTGDRDKAPFGGFLQQIDGFDADFFGISPREAESMDPQQRLVLEVAWEALEHAGIAIARLRGSQTGVFIGATTTDYGKLAMSGDPATLDAYTATGNALNVIAGRVSYLLGLNGPAMAIDTACSSSVVAVHLACQSLRSGECSLALAGGVNALITAESFICFERWGMMSPRGQCRAFDAGADGFVRAEGCGVVILKRLSDALADGDSIMAVIRASAVNQDGASSGLTVPNGPAQQAVIRRALETGRIDAGRIGYVEAHGTGTNIGDPIEIEAIGSVLCRNVERAEPLRVGSVKSNLGHMESAAGIGGLIKAALCLERESIPLSLHFETPNPRIDWHRYAIEIPTKAVSWPRAEVPRLAAVSGFGFSGTNGHLILEEAPATREATDPVENQPGLLCLSAKTPAALRDLADRYASRFDAEPNINVADVCHAATKRASFTSRLAVIGESAETFARQLRAYRNGDTPGPIVSEQPATETGDVHFLFTGQGSQYSGMGAELYEHEPIFRTALDRCTDILRPSLEHAVRDVMFDERHAALLKQTAYTQPALFAIEWALAELWRAWGLTPSTVTGHSVGEYVAACVADVMTLEDSLRLLTRRAQLMQSLPGGGGMTSVLASEADVLALIDGQSAELAIAAVNSPDSAVISGRLPALDKVESELTRRGITFTRLEVSHAFHSPLMEPMLPAFAEAARGVEYRQPSCKFLSNLTGRPADERGIDADYWVRHVRQAVRFADCVSQLNASPADAFVEIGPAPVLLGLARQCLPAAKALWLPSLRPGKGARVQMLESLGAAFVSGHRVQVGIAAPDRKGGHRLRLPTYPFQRSRHWLPATTPTVHTPAPASRLLGSELDLATSEGRRVWEQEMSLKRFPFVDDHRVQGTPIVPATAYIEMMLQAAECHYGETAVRITNIDIRRAILLRPDDRQKVQMELEPVDTGGARARIYSRKADDGARAWQLNVSADLEVIAETDERPELRLFETLKERCAQPVSGQDFYRLQAAKGNQWGALFQGVQTLWTDGDEALCRVEVPAPLRGELQKFRFHPAVSDACGHVLVGTIPLEASDGPLGGAFVGGGVGEARFHARPKSTTLWCHARRRPSPGGDANVLCGDVTVFDDTGALVSETIDARLWYLDDAGRADMAGYEDWLYRIDWEKCPPPGTDAPSTAADDAVDWLLIADAGGAARAMERRLLELDEPVAVIDSSDSVTAIAEALESGRAQRIVDLRFLDAQQGDFQTATARSLAGLQLLVKKLATARRPASTKLWIVTRGAVSATGEERDISPAQALGWGFGRTVAVEHAEFWGGLIDLDPAATQGECAIRMVEHLQRKGPEDQAALRSGDVYVPRLAPQRVRPESTAFMARQDGSYLISGGLGGLGLVVAERLAERGAGHLLLLSRRQFPARSEWAAWAGDDDRVRAQIQTIRRIEEKGCRVSVAAVDVSDGAALERELDERAADIPPIRGVVHAAGIMQYEAIVDHGVSAMQSVVGSKAVGAWELHRLLHDAPLDFFVMFSSASSLLSSPFMSSYAAANASLDTLAMLRHACDLPALSINWGTWREAGMVLDFDVNRDVKLKGVGTLSNREGLGALEHLLRTDVPQAGIMKIDWPEWQKNYAAFAASPYLQRFLAADTGASRGPAPTLTASHLRSVDEGDRLRLVEAFLVQQVERIFKMPAGALDITRPLAESGLDSLMAVELRNVIDSAIGVGLPMVRLVEGPSIADLTNAITREFSVTAVRQGIPRIPRTGQLPLSHAQRSLWFLDQLDPGSGAYVIPSALAIHGEIDIRLVEKCLTEIVTRHESLRTVFISDDGSPRVTVQEPHEITVPMTDISALPASEQDNRISRFVADNAHQPFDLTTGPLMRARFVRLGASEHLLLLAFHHIVFDYWSAGIFVKELTKLYESFHNHQPSPLADLPIQFLDFAHWQARRLDEGGREQHLAYWQKQLDADLSFLSLPADKPRSKAQSARGANCSLRVGEELTRALAQFSQRQNVTLAMTLLAAFQVLLHRLSGQDRVQTGMPVAGRDRPETTDLIGFFINTVVIRSDFSAQMTFREFLQQIRSTALGAYEHQDMPFQELVAVLDPVRDMQRTPLFQAFFNHINMSVPAFELPGATVEPLLQLDLGSKFDLSFYAQEQDDDLNLMLVYNGDLFDAERMARFLDQYILLLKQVQLEPERPLGTYTLVDGQARHSFPDPLRPLALNANYASGTLAARHIGAYGDRTALVGPTGQWSYRQLDERANQLASMLLDSGIQRGEVIVLYAQRDPLLVCSMLGVLRAGAAFAVLDQAYPDARSSDNFRAANPRGMLLVGNVAAPGKELEAAVTSANLRIRLQVTDAAFTESPLRKASVAHPDLVPDDIAYIAFTSGTTGGAKAIVGTHLPVAHFLDWQKDVFKLQEGDRFSLLSGLSHDPLLRDVFAPLWSGGSLHIPEPEAIRDPLRLVKWLEVEEVSVAHLTPAIATLLTMADASHRLTTLRYAFFGGDVLPAGIVDRMREVSPGLHCVNFYGATETPQAMSYYSMPPGEADIRERVPLGHGIDGAQLLIVNTAQTLAGVGEVGEIVVRTPFLTQGYRDDETLTRQRFTSNPYTGDDCDRIYKTGDLGRYLPDGAVEIIGRMDGQIQLRGFRIELGAVEAAVNLHPDVRQCAVVLREDTPGDPRLVAYMMLADTAAEDQTSMRTFLERQLPEHAVPSAIVMMDELPLTPNGKLDRKALPAPVAPATEALAAETQTPGEEIVANLFANVLNLQHVGRHQSFFQLGGHSLLAAKVIARLNRHFRVELPLRALFEAPTPAKFAVQLERLLQVGAETEYLPIDRLDPGCPAPLSYAQERLWYLHELAPENTAYNLAGALELHGLLDTQALDETFCAIVKQHESLRTCIGLVDGWPVQQVTDPSRFTLETIELPASISETELRNLLQVEARQPLDLQHGPLFRAVLYRLAPKRSVFLFICHHIVTDGWSFGVFVRELSALYNRVAAGGKAELPLLPIQYRDYAAWQRGWLEGERLETLLQYWRSRLKGAPAHLDLPADRPRPPEFSYRGARYTFELPVALRDGLQALSRHEGATLFMTLLASFQLLLSRYSGERDIVVGSPVANRSRPELEDMIGFFVNTLVLRTELSDDMGFRELLSNVRDTCLGAYAHQQLPFEKLVEALQPERDLSRNPVFQVMFVLQNMALPPLTLGDVRIAPYPLERSGAQFDLSLYMWETPAGLQATFEYATDLFDESAIERLAGHFRNLLQGAVDSPATNVLRLPLLSGDERQELLTERHGTAIALNDTETVLDLFGRQADRRPQAVAAEYDGRQWTYAELEARSNRIAQHLRSLGVGPNSLVGLCLPRGLDMLAGLLGILKAGGAWLPLDPDFPAERLRFMLEDSGAEVLLSLSSVTLNALGEQSFVRVNLDTDQGLFDRYGSEPLDAAVEVDHLAYIIYTSGSTGRPKGVEIEHRALVNFLRSMAEEPGLNESDTLLAVTTLSFDISILELFLPLTTGARVVIASRETAVDGQRLRSLLNESRATVMQATPATWRLLLEAGWQGGEGFRVLCGGEPLPAELLEPLASRAGEVWNLYGPTETTIWSSCARLQAGDAVHIGRPIANTALYIVDAHGELQPPGVAGEIWIGGEGVARGYLGRPELTAERFLPDPYTPGGRVYRTGDQGRWRADGTLQHLGRIDNQIKVRGYRIEPGEIEARLAEGADISQAVVSVWQAAEGDQRLVAYYLGEADLTAADLRASLQQTLPDYMIPQYFVRLDALPLTPNGKIDRKALPAPQDGETAAAAFAPPETATERQLAEIWQELLGVEPIGRGDNFFERGGHSLLAARASARMNTLFGVDFPLRVFFEAPLLQDLASRIDAARQTSSVDPSASLTTPIRRIPRKGDLPLSHAQRRLWFLDRLEPGSSAYVMPSACVVRGEIDASLLQQSLTEIVRRHESLRTVFASIDGAPRVAIREAFTVSLPVTDLSAVPSAEREEHIRRLVADNASRPFDLAQGPLLRANLFRLDASEYLLLMAFHHIVFDFWSARLFVGEVARLYESFMSGEPSPLPELPVQFLDFADWQAKRLDDGGREQHLRYWQQQLGSSPAPLDLPTDRPRSTAKSVRGAKCSCHIDQETTRALAAFSQQQNVTLAMALLAAFHVLLHRLSGQEQTCVGMPVAGRDRPETENLIGFFINTVVLRTDLTGPTTFRAFLEQVREATLGALEHQEMPFEELVAALDPERDLSRTPLFQAFFNHINMAVPALEIPGATIEPLMQFDLESKFELTLYAQEQDDALNLLLVYNAELFDEARMSGLLRQYALLLEQALKSPDRPVQTLSLVGEPARRVLPDPARPLDAKVSASGTLTARHIGNYGESTALVGPEGEWSYRELDERANGLASLLVEAGIRRGDIVALYAQRDPLLVCAMLGVLRAGAGFAMLDSSYPDARLAENFRAAAPRGFLRVGNAADPGTELEHAIRSAELAIRLDLPDAAIIESFEASDTPHPDLGPDDVAYIAFTSGTTGGAKAIIGTHGPVAHFLDWQQEKFGLSADDRFSMLSGLSHDPLLRDVFAPLWNGGSLHVPEPAAVRDPAALTRWMQSEAISVAHLTPALAGLLTMSGASARLDTLRYAFLGGDVLYAETVTRLREQAAQLHCVNFYGATETPQAMGYWSLPPDAGLRERIPVGFGIDGVELLVLNSGEVLAGVGEVGEIVVRTPFLTRGYRGDEVLTRQRFVSNPYTADDRDRMYRTGDLGRYLPDGAVEIIGRHDGQVQLRGFRIELGAVKAAVDRHPLVRESAVVLREDTPGDPRLVAYLVLADAAGDALSGVRSLLEESLPEHAVPSFFVTLDALPLTLNGKLDRKALPAPAIETTATGEEAPRSPSEEILAETFADVLNLQHVGRHQNFFQLGGHSLLAARVVARLNSHFRVELPLRTLFEAPTPAKLGVHLDRLLQDGDEAGYLAIERRDPAEPAPLSYAQERLWYLHQLAPGNSAYNLAGALELRGELDEAALADALSAIVRRHEPLRTAIGMRDGWPVQIATDAPRFAPETVELPPDTSGADLKILLTERIRQPFDLRVGPLLRTILYRLAPDRHVFLFVCHHVVTDGWSMGVFVRELGALYSRLVKDAGAELPPLPIQYTDYAVWQRNWLQGERLEHQLEYWRTKLEGAPSHLELATDRLRPPEFSYRGARYTFELPPALRDQLLALSRREGATLFMTLLASFQLLLSRYSNQRDIVVGSPVANRSRPELEDMIGFFVNTLALRTELSDDLSFRELLNGVRDTCLGAYAHQQLPFEKLVEALQPERDLSRNPVFQVMFVLQNMALPPLTLGDVRIAPYPLERSGAQLDLSLYMWETSAGLQATFEYATDLFDESTIERLAGHFHNLLQGAVDNPASNILRLPLLNGDERQELLTEHKGTAIALAATETVLDLFGREADRRPQAVAAECDGLQWTYAELEARSNRIAHHLRALGVGPDSLVGLCVPRGLDMLAGLFGILKAGGAWLPLDPDFPAERLRFMLEDSGAEVLVSLSSVALDALDDLSFSRLNLDTDQALFERYGSERLDAAVQGDHLAYILYTSGSTGRPKGVEIEHRALLNFLRSMAEEPGLAESDTLLAVTTLSFDISILELFLPLTTGARVVIASRETAVDGQRLKSLLGESRASAMQATPATWRMLIESGWEGNAHLKALCGGESFPSDLAAALLERVGEVWNMYGPTETTIWSTCARITSAKAVHIGRPIANTDVYILNDKLEPQPTGVPGQLFIGGAGLARGYHRRPDLTAENFVAHPFSGGFSGNGRIYRTGDRALWRQDGNIEHLGRIDNQVKVRGYRIELGEIEACLAEHPDVKQCAVALTESRPGDQRLTAWYVADGGRQTTATSLRSHLKSVLPPYMIPQHFIELEALPLTPNGKIDRKALAARGGGATPVEHRHVPPATGAEKRLAALWKEVLDAERIGVHDNFFDIGGHSLLAARLVNQLDERFGVRITLQALTADTLGQIAATLEESMAGNSDAAAMPGGGAASEGSPAGFFRKLLRRQATKTR